MAKSSGKPGETEIKLDTSAAVYADNVDLLPNWQLSKDGSAP
jgi:hypothetical protein